MISGSLRSQPTIVGIGKRHKCQTATDAAKRLSATDAAQIDNQQRIGWIALSNESVLLPTWGHGREFVSSEMCASPKFCAHHRMPWGLCAGNPALTTLFISLDWDSAFFIEYAWFLFPYMAGGLFEFCVDFRSSSVGLNSLYWQFFLFSNCTE